MLQLSKHESEYTYLATGTQGSADATLASGGCCVLLGTSLTNVVCSAGCPAVSANLNSLKMRVDVLRRESSVNELRRGSMIGKRA